MRNKIVKIPELFNNIIKLEKELKIKDEKYWVKRGQSNVIKLFKLMSVRVPAYKDFLKRNRVDSSLINTVRDLKNIPPLDKENYLRKYPLESMCWDGKLSQRRWTVATNSGSTGDPFYFPREIEQDYQYAALAELYLRDNFGIQNTSTLYLDCFAMGAWIGGLFTYEALRIVAEKGKYPLTVYTPGIFKSEIIKAIKILAPKFERIIIGGYPPLVKDVIDEGINENIDWKKYKLGFVFSAEGFTEEFRNYIYQKAGITNYFTSSLNHYGTADMGTMAYETPLSILIRKIANENLSLKNTIFMEKNKLPTLTQYFPELFYFEEENSTLYCSAYSGIPFLRYNLKDYGKILEYGEVLKSFADNGLDLKELASKNKISLWKLPFVYLYDRQDFVVKLYGANIFPETIHHVVQQKVYEKLLTTKFTIGIKFDIQQNQYLEINFELKRNVKNTEELAIKLQKEIVRLLLLENSEYASNYKSLRERQMPHIVFSKYEDPVNFKVGGKHKWVSR